MTKRSKDNPYGLTPVIEPPPRARKPEPVVTPVRKPLFEVGDEVQNGFFHHSPFTIRQPVIVRDIIADAHFTSGYKVGVDTTDGIHYLDSRYFSPLTTTPCSEPLPDHSHKETA